MDSITREELQSYLNKELHRPAKSTFHDDEIVPVLLMILGVKIDALIKLTEERNSGN
jgi:hypothetical protein